MKEEVLLLSAGFGTRLGELTKEIPKPLVKVNDKSLIEMNLEHLSRAGYKKVFINTHYKADKIVEFVSGGEKWGLEIEYSHEDDILDTGGALAKIANKITSENLLIINSDIVIDNKFSFSDFTDFHLNQNKLASLVVKSDPSLEINGQLGVNKKNEINKFLDYGSKQDYTAVFFTGISLLSQDLFKKDFVTIFKDKKFSLTKDIFLNCLNSNEILSAYLMSSYWCDAGTPKRLEQAKNYLNKIL